MLPATQIIIVTPVTRIVLIMGLDLSVNLAKEALGQVVILAEIVHLIIAEETPTAEA